MQINPNIPLEEQEIIIAGLEQEWAELQNMINRYKQSSTSPLQVAGDDTVEGVYSRTVEFNRIKYQ